MKIFSTRCLLLLLTFFFSLSVQVNANAFHDERLVYKNIIQSVSSDGSLVTLDDGTTFTVDWWYRSVPQKWSAGSRIYISYDFQYGECKLEHSISQDVAWAKKTRDPSIPPKRIKGLSNGQNDPDCYSKIILDNGYCFRSIEDRVFDTWKVNSLVAVLANPTGLYQVWNLNKNEIALCNCVGNSNQSIRDPIEIADIFSLKDRLDAKVLQQGEATKALVDSLLIYSAGLKDKEAPIGVFLFIGPTGVGKTELAKALAFEMYKSSSATLRFDMSHFTESHSISRLIGSQPGYVNHEEGGQLTNPLIENPQRIVLLDELDKAHPQVIKAFLPVFDEGFILDTKNNRISCCETIFIMTSNLCSEQISRLYYAGYSTEAILEVIEPELMQQLSPELYNRVQPILFQPLAKETMGALVELMLDKIKEKMTVERKIQLQIDDSLKSFLVEHGYHPLLGARPLKKLIQKEVLTALADHFIREKVQNGSEILLFYDKDSDSVGLRDCPKT